MAGDSGGQPGDIGLSPCVSPRLGLRHSKERQSVRGENAMADDRPAWARRMTNEREARGWSQADAVRAMRAHAPMREDGRTQLPEGPSLLRQWKRWEAGEVEPDGGKAEPFYKPIIAATFGTVTHAMFPVSPR